MIIKCSATRWHDLVGSIIARVRSRHHLLLVLLLLLGHVDLVYWQHERAARRTHHIVVIIGILDWATLCRRLVKERWRRIDVVLIILNRQPRLLLHLILLTNIGPIIFNIELVGVADLVLLLAMFHGVVVLSVEKGLGVTAGAVLVLITLLLIVK